MYDIGPPFIWYNITIDILEFGGVEETMEGGRESLQVNWIPVSTLAISPEMPLRRSEDGRVSPILCETLVCALATETAVSAITDTLFWNHRSLQC